MTWAKVDDRLHGHSKARRAREALALWVLAMSWCADELTDGAIPRDMPDLLLPGLGESFAARLVEVGLWERTDEGYQFHDWLDYQPSARKVKSDKAKTSSARAAAGRAGMASRWAKTNPPVNSQENSDNKPHNKPVASGVTNALQNNNPVPDPVPVPNPDQREENSLPTVGSSARASAHAHTHEGLALEVEAPKAKRTRVKPVPPPDTVPPEGTAAHRVYLAVVRDSALGPVTTGPGDLAMRLVAIADGTTVDPAAEVVAAGAWLARHPGRWRDGASGLVSWIKRAADDARRMPIAATGMARQSTQAPVKVDYQGRRVVGAAGLPDGSVWDRTDAEVEEIERRLYEETHARTQPRGRQA